VIVVVFMEDKQKFTVGGVEVLLSREDVEQKLQGVAPENIREVSVLVNGKRYPVKQALAEAAGLLRGNFTSHDAMRVFRKLALPVGTGPGEDILTAPERFFTVVKSLNAFDQKEVRGVIGGLVLKKDRDHCFTGIYIRAKANIESLLSLKYVRDVQASIMIARSLFELAVDMKLIDVTQDAVKKIAAFSEVEKLKSARRIVEFKAAHPNPADTSTVHADFIMNNAARIEAEQSALWPRAKKVGHWSGLDMRSRAILLKEPFDEIYDLKYSELSWYTHAAGLTGFDLKAETYPILQASSFELAAKCYVILLTAIIDEFGLSKANPGIKRHLDYALKVPFTDTEEQAEALHRVLMG
jgi:hypothetical protein